MPRWDIHCKAEHKQPGDGLQQAKNYTGILGLKFDYNGFLAPYRVHRIVTQRDAAGWRPSKDDLDRYGGAIPGEIYADFGTNAYNFVKLENPPAYEPTHCDGCGVVSPTSRIGGGDLA